MKIEDDIKILKGYRQRLEASCSNQLDADKEAFDVAINALETGEIYMTGKDYDLFLEGYKQGKKDFERPLGNLIQSLTELCDRYCKFCPITGAPNGNDCTDCICTHIRGIIERGGADMRDKKK